MSADEILAANLWPWPDPLLKRDRSGQVLFVNSAFLQLYGGRIEDWRGNMISGWPAPAAQGAQRFETRAGETPHETVYDWVEMVMADGNAMAIARNVTALVPAPTPPGDIALPPADTPVQFEAPLEQPAAPVNTVETTPPAPEPVIAPPPPAPVQEPAPALASPPSAQEPVAEVVGQDAAPDLSDDLEDTLNRKAEDYLSEDGVAAAAASPEKPAEPAATLETPVQPAPAAEQSQNDESGRMFERRALPIEDSSAVLGSNWRDQVIAKAVGAEAPEDDAEEETPIATPEAQEEADTSAGAKVGVGLRILLAEDNAINALLTRTLLEAEGAVVDTVEDGALAVQAVQKEQYDLIFMDMRMPNMDGLESTRKIRALGGRNKDLPIVALTANAFDDDRNACFDSGMNDFMTKPVSAEELQEMVETWTKKEQKLAS